MNSTRVFFTLCSCFCISVLHAQKQPEPDKKQGLLSFGVTLSDYNFVKQKDSSNHNGNTQKGLFRPGNGSFGIVISYWKHLMSHIDFSGNFGTDLSNFPAGFVKGDSIGQAGVSVHLDALIHLKAFAANAKVNPFITAGAGGGSFGKQTALYAPLGAGITFHFSEGGILIVQAQMRDALSTGITNNFMYYSACFSSDVPVSRKKNKSNKDDVVKSALASDSHVVAQESQKNSFVRSINGSSHTRDMLALKKSAGHGIKTNITALSPFPDSDGDGVADKDDKCPGIKGPIENGGCPFPTVKGADIRAMSNDSVTYSIHFDFDRSDLDGESFATLNRIVNILKTDNTLMVHISGHADNQGSDQKNMQVSADRAKVTSDYFMSYNIAASRITTSYYGASRPIDTVQQWQNRRVEITIIKK